MMDGMYLLPHARLHINPSLPGQMHSSLDTSLRTGSFNNHIRPFTKFKKLLDHPCHLLTPRTLLHPLLSRRRIENPIRPEGAGKLQPRPRYINAHHLLRCICLTHSLAEEPDRPAPEDNHRLVGTDVADFGYLHGDGDGFHHGAFFEVDVSW
ncbi:hypothetical protein AWENTII_005065 [Aspergillus wentii]